MDSVKISCKGHRVISLAKGYSVLRISQKFYKNKEDSCVKYLSACRNGCWYDARSIEFPPAKNINNVNF
jgi:hypothetical protein